MLGLPKKPPENDEDLRGSAMRLRHRLLVLAWVISAAAENASPTVLMEYGKTRGHREAMRARIRRGDD
jgi:hypothetical protein